MSQFSSMRNLTAANRTYLLGGDRDDCCRLSGEGYKLHLVSLLPRVNMHHGPDIARLKALVVQTCGQYYPVVFANHIYTILKRVRRDQSWKTRARVDDPDGSDAR